MGCSESESPIQHRQNLDALFTNLGGGTLFHSCLTHHTVGASPFAPFAKGGIPHRPAHPYPVPRSGTAVFSGQAFRPAFAKGERGTVPRRACELKGKCRESKETVPSLRRRPGVPGEPGFGSTGWRSARSAAERPSLFIYKVGVFSETLEGFLAPSCRSYLNQSDDRPSPRGSQEPFSIFVRHLLEEEKLYENMFNACVSRSCCVWGRICSERLRSTGS
jgi:hypothetical protein